MSDEPRGQWLTTSEAAAMLRVSEKTIRRRIKAGELTATKKPLDGGGIGWRVQIGAQNGTGVDTVMDNDVDTHRNRSGHRDGHNHVQAQSEVDNEVDVMDNVMDTRAGTVMDKAMDGDRRGEVEVELRAQLAREREFSAILKSQLEAVTQSEAQTKAALREALRVMPKQLTTGTPETPEREQSGAANNVPSVTTESAQTPTKRDGAALSYGDIADELERSMRK